MPESCWHRSLASTIVTEWLNTASSLNGPAPWAHRSAWKIAAFARQRPRVQIPLSPLRNPPAPGGPSTSTGNQAYPLLREVKSSIRTCECRWAAHPGGPWSLGRAMKQRPRGRRWSRGQPEGGSLSFDTGNGSGPEGSSLTVYSRCPGSHGAESVLGLLPGSTLASTTGCGPKLRRGHNLFTARGLRGQRDPSQ